MPKDEQYSEWRGVQSGHGPGTVKGLLELDSDAQAFRYRKQLHLHLRLDQFGFRAGLDLTGKWHIRLRESAAPDAKILFEQEVEWRAQLIAIVDPFFGSIGLVTWMPLDNGDGTFKTTIIDSAPVDPGEAWKQTDFLNPRLLDMSIPDTGNSRREIGITDFDPIGAATGVSYDFFATFYSPFYKTFIPQGAVLDRVSDNWGIGFLDQNATYEFSFKAAQPSLDATLDHFDGLLCAYMEGGMALVSLAYKQYGAPQLRAAKDGPRQASICEDRHGRIWMVAKEPGNTGLPASSTGTESSNTDTSTTGTPAAPAYPAGWWESVSLNGGHTFEPLLNDRGERIGPLWPVEVGDVRPLMLDDGTAVSVALHGYKVLFKTRRVDQDGTILVGELERRQALTPIYRNGVLYIVGEEGVLFTSKDGGATWAGKG